MVDSKASDLPSNCSEVIEKNNLPVTGFYKMRNKKKDETFRGYCVIGKGGDPWLMHFIENKNR